MVWYLMLYAEELITIFRSSAVFLWVVRKRKPVNSDICFSQRSNLQFAALPLVLFSFTLCFLIYNRQAQMKSITSLLLTSCTCYWKSTMLPLFED